MVKKCIQRSDYNVHTMSRKPKEENTNEDQLDRQQVSEVPPALHFTQTTSNSLTNMDPSMGSLSHFSSHQTQIQSNAALLSSRELPQKVNVLQLVHHQGEKDKHQQKQQAITQEFSHTLRQDDEGDAQQRKPQAMPSLPLGFTPQAFVSSTSEGMTLRKDTVAKSSSTTAGPAPVAYGDLTVYRAGLEKGLDEIPEFEKYAYTQAMVSCPAEVRNNEANLDWFLRIEELNCPAAAKRIVQYWQLRLDTFDEKAFHPLNQTGEGALERKELTVLGTGFLNLLPADSYGSPVLSMDIFRLKKSSSADSIRRCMFYMFLLLAESEQSRQPGATLLIMLDSSSLDKINISFLERLCDCLPIRFKAVHLLSFESVSPNIVSKVQFGREVFLHVAASKVELAQKLEPFGLQRSGLPKRFGGEWGFDKYVDWQELRTRMEWKIPFGLSGRGAEATSTNRECPDTVPYTQLSKEEKIERKRRMNVIHSRRKRDRERVEIDLLQEQIEELQEKKARLLQENEVLENLSQSAKANLLSIMRGAAGGTDRLPSVGATGGQQSWQDYPFRRPHGLPGSNSALQLAARQQQQQQQQQQYSNYLNQFSLSGQNYPSLMGPSLFCSDQVQRSQTDSNRTHSNAAHSESPSEPQSYSSAIPATSLPISQLEPLLNPVELALLRAALQSPAGSHFSALPQPQVGRFPLNPNAVSSLLLMQPATQRSEERKSSSEEDDQKKKAATP